MLFLGSPLCQLVFGVADVPLDGDRLFPSGLRVYTGHVDHFLHNGAAIGEVFNGDEMADLLDPGNGLVVDDLHVVDEPPKAQIGCFGQLRTGFVNDFHR